MDVFDDLELVKRYRFSREGITTIRTLLSQILSIVQRLIFALAFQQVLTALQYYATGTFQYVVWDPLQVSQQTASIPCSARQEKDFPAESS
jgi:hypothetical protein